MMQVIQQTHKQKMKMYMKCTKKKLAEMLIECNRILDAQMEVKNLSLNLPVMRSFANLCRECGKMVAKPREYCDEHYPYKISK